MQLLLDLGRPLPACPDNVGSRTKGFHNIRLSGSQPQISGHGRIFNDEGDVIPHPRSGEGRQRGV